MSEGARNLLSLRNTLNLMNVAGFNRVMKGHAEFKLLGKDSDIFEPKQSRVVQIIDCLSNFGTVREDYVQKFEELDTESTDLTDERRSLLAEQAELAREVAELTAQRSAEEESVKELVNTNAELTRRIKQLNEAQARLKGQKDELELQLKLHKTDIKAAMEQISRFEEQSQLLCGKIIDPTKVAEQIRKNQQDIEFGKKDIETQTADIAKSNQRIAAFDRIAQNVTKVTEQLALVKSSAEKEGSYKARLSQTRTELQERRHLLQEEETRHQSAANSLQSCQENMARLKKTRGEKMLQLQQDLKSKIAAHREAQETSESTLRQIEQNTRTTEETEAQIVDLRKRHQLACQELQKTYDELVAQLRQYHNALRQAIATSS